MRILFVADWRSVIARSWIQGVLTLDHECRVLSTFPVAPDRETALQVDSVPIAMAALAGRPWSFAAGPATAPTRTAQARTAGARPWWLPTGHAERLVSVARGRIAPYDLARQRPAAQKIIASFRPALVHALRIPFEGMFATTLTGPHRTIVSTWGNDLTLHAPASGVLGRRTRSTLASVHGLVLDCERDVGLARTWGYPASRPTIVLPGNGGVHLPAPPTDEAVARTRHRLRLAVGTPMVLSPRGPREYLRLANLCQAIPSVLREHPDSTFVFADAEHSRPLTELAHALGISASCRFLPCQSAAEMAGLFSAADVFVSPSAHDGTPNTLIEGMAAGCLPVAGSTASIREWITPDHNGLLCDPERPADIAAAVTRALRDDRLRKDARELNRDLVSRRADRDTTLLRADEFYHRIAS